MPTCFVLNKMVLNKTALNSNQTGFTLVEIMAVVMIIGVMVGLAVISVGGQPERQLKMEAQRIFQKMRLVEEDAEFSASEKGVSIIDNQLTFYEFDEVNMEWKPLEEEGFSAVVLEDDYLLELKVEREELEVSRLYPSKASKKDKVKDYGEKKYEEPQIFFFSDGQLSSFELKILNKNIPKKNYTIRGINPGRLTLVANET